MYLIKERYIKDIIINKSKFIGILIPLNDELKVKDVLKELNKEFPKATHYCYAYRINNKEKSSDDGEPSGTAGRPILEFLIKNNLVNVLAVVIRYFGGIKLGSGGLIRAYNDSMKEVYSISQIYRIENQNEYLIESDYSYFDHISSYLKKQNGSIEDTTFEDKVKIIYLSSLISENDLNEITNGNIKITKLGNKEVYILEKEN